jgi:hypothetical protein
MMNRGGFFLTLLAGLSFCVSSISFAVTVSDYGEVYPAGGKTGDPCYTLDDVSLIDTGYIRLRFKYTDHYCKKEVYFSETINKGKIRGVIGINGVSSKSIFTIDVEPDTAFIIFDMAGSYGKLSQVRFPVQKYIAVAKRANTGWQSAWKRSEQNLREGGKKDKNSPKIVLLSPDVTPRNQVFRVDTYQITIRGKVSDDSGVATVLVNGSKAGVRNDGSFGRKVRLAFGTNNIKVQAEDVHGNLAERTFSVIREEFIPDETLGDVDLPLKTRMRNPDGLGVVIGVENYQYVAPATYAYNDAEVVREYLAQTTGFQKNRLKLITNSRATQAEFDKLLGPNGWLARNVKKGKSDIVVYFSGHGIPEVRTKRLGLLPFDVDPNYSIGLPLNDLYRTLAGLEAKSVTVLLDACFSGQNREKKLLVADARGITVTPKQLAVPKNVTVLAAASGSEISGALKEKEHGVFTYYLLKGLGGAADGNLDRRLTVDELATYVSGEVQKQAAQLGWEQAPYLSGPDSRVLVEW